MLYNLHGSLPSFLQIFIQMPLSERSLFRPTCLKSQLPHIFSTLFLSLVFLFFFPSFFEVYAICKKLETFNVYILVNLDTYVYPWYQHHKVINIFSTSKRFIVSPCSACVYRTLSILASTLLTILSAQHHIVTYSHYVV